jgi:hypothetical protein
MRCCGANQLARSPETAGQMASELARGLENQIYIADAVCAAHIREYGAQVADPIQMITEKADGRTEK